MGGCTFRLTAEERGVSAAGMAVAASSIPAVRGLLPSSPEFHFIFLGATYSAFAHFHVVLNLGLGKFSVLAEENVYTEPDHAQGDKEDCCNEYLHQLMKLELIGS